MIAAIASIAITASIACATSTTSPGDDGRVAIAVLDVSAQPADAEIAKAAAAVVAGEMGKTGAVRVIAAEDVRRMLSFQANKDATGCTGDASCLAELANALGVPYLWTGTLTRVDGVYVLSSSLLDLAKASPVSREAVRAEKSAELLDALVPSTQRALEPILRLAAGTLRVTVSEEGATVAVDGVVVGTSPLARPIDTAGRRRVTVTKDGFVKAETDVVVLPQKSAAIDVTLAPSQETLADYRAHASTMRLAAWSTIAGAVVSGGGGGALFAVNAARADELKKSVGGGVSASEQQTFLARDVGGFALLSVGAVLAGTSAFLFAIGDDPSKYDAAPSSSTATLASR